MKYLVCRIYLDLVLHISDSLLQDYITFRITRHSYRLARTLYADVSIQVYSTFQQFVKINCSDLTCEFSLSYSKKCNRAFIFSPQTKQKNLIFIAIDCNRLLLIWYCWKMLINNFRVEKKLIKMRDVLKFSLPTE